MTTISDLPVPPSPGRLRRARILGPPSKWVPLAPKESANLTLDGPGVLRRIWCVFNTEGKPAASMDTLRKHRDIYRNIWLHVAFDEHGEAQVSAPLADFFLFGHGDLEDVDSHYLQAVRVLPLDEPPYQGALSCFVPMPFRVGAQISFENRNDIPVRLIAACDWLEQDQTEAPLYFHATFTHRQTAGGPLVVLDRRETQGTFLGLGLYVANADPAHRWHEALDTFAIDGADPLPGTGVEDYFGLAWGFRQRVSRSLFGVTCTRPGSGSTTLPTGRFDAVGEFAMYRFHLHDPVSFARSFRFQFGNAHPSLEYRSVAFWYGRRRQPEAEG
jgi:hypothetical protein